MKTQDWITELYNRVSDQIWDPEPQYDPVLSMLDKDDVELLYSTLKEITNRIEGKLND